MSAAAVEWLDERFEAAADALAAMRRRDPLDDNQRRILREAHVETGMPPRPSRQWDLAGRAWRWWPGTEPGPDDWREHP